HRRLSPTSLRSLPYTTPFRSRLMHRRVAGHLAPALSPGIAGEAVFEDGDVIVGLGNLGLQAPGAGRAERAELGRRVVGALLAPGDRKRTRLNSSRETSPEGRL